MATGTDSDRTGALAERVANIESYLVHLATRADIESVKTLIAERETTMLRWLVGMVSAAGLTVAVAMVRTFIA